MRILFLAHRLPYPPNKGDKIRSFWELSSLGERHEVDLFCFYDDPADEFHISGLRNYCDSCYAEPISVFGSRVRAVSALMSGRAFSSAFYYSRTMATRIADTVRRKNYDAVFIFGSTMAQYVEHMPHLPRILDLVDVDSDKWLQYASRTRRPLSWVWRTEAHRLQLWERELVDTFSNTLVCTEAEARLLRGIAPTGNVTVLQNSVDTDYYRPEAVQIPESIRRLQPYVVFTGSMDYFPNVDAVQFFGREVFPLIRDQVPDLRFVIAGRNPVPEVVRLSAEPGIELTRDVPDMRPYLLAASVAVAPMRIARGVQNKILEALAMDIPVVASPMAAGALPKELALLVMAESEPKHIAARVKDYILAPARTGARRTFLKRYLDALDLSGQLEQLVHTAAANSSEHQDRSQLLKSNRSCA
jgi:polysaccharide biosynthesis protein PslH